MLARPPQLSRALTYYALAALFTIGIVYHFVSLQDSFIARVPGLPGHAQQQEEEQQQAAEIPKLIWYKLGPNGLSDDARAWTDTCIKNNTGYKAHFLTDEDSDAYVRKTFAFRQDIVDTYLALPIPIFKADLLRYLLLWDQGGIWSDLDVSCKDTPIDEWVPASYKSSAAIVVGWEFDQGWPGKYVRQFASWTIMSKPRSPHMMQVVDDILETVRVETMEHGVGVQNVTLEMMGDVVDFTGPRRLTRSVFKSLEKQMNHTLDVSEFHEIFQPRLVGDVLIMPGQSFAASSNTYTAEQQKELPPQLVEHHYAGSWKNDKGGE
ncbi:glycosyltransferase [Bipolaris maydis]|nr:glycosyltransferase [Bipolaris maydis]